MARTKKPRDASKLSAPQRRKLVARYHALLRQIEQLDRQIAALRERREPLRAELRRIVASGARRQEFRAKAAERRARVAQLHRTMGPDPVAIASALGCSPELVRRAFRELKLSRRRRGRPKNS